ncbi:hypothetical protein GGX14DRAFT_557802 [Mycena pura]|uniref:Uncharacterized protein n=1 Tax=Mycena pura TaxID=153505 RepID=A0AAD7E0Z0_9AGAR|nr:hypothetical protein GGX14DRAFT_557802 [Mycena pura]
MQQPEQQRDANTPAEMGHTTALALEQRESWLRGQLWVAEAADERRATGYIRDTRSWATAALYNYAHPRLQKIERASRRALDRQDFEGRARVDPLPADALEEVEAARHRRRLRVAAGGSTQAASLAVDWQLQCETTAARPEATAADITWGSTEFWGVGEAWPTAVDVSAGKELTDEEPAIKEAEARQDLVATWKVLTVGPEPWWALQPGRDLQEVDDMPSPPRYAKALPFLE